MRRTAICAVLAVAALTVLGGACGDGNGRPSSGAQKMTKPVVTVPDVPPPNALQVKDLVVGTGAEAKAGMRIVVQYVGVAYSTKKEFDSSWDRGQTFPFTLGTGEVIKGWDQGIVGMKVGGRRELVIPPSLAYGSRGAGDGMIKPNETLIFIVDFVATA